MPDWQKLVQSRLSTMALDCHEREEVVAELADHLEETYTSLRAQGFAEQAAINRTTLQVTDWGKLQTQIQNARQKENAMTPRTARFWLPSLVTLIVSMSMLPALEWMGLKPEVLSLRGLVFAVYPVWLLALPIVGALGAYLSRRAGGAYKTMVLSGVFPALAFSVILILVIPFASILEHGLVQDARPMFHALISSSLGYLGVISIWVLLPGASLFVGVLAYRFLAKGRLQPAN